MATTTGGTTYVTGTDLVSSYPTASLALANRVDVVASGGPVLVKTSGYTITVADILAGNKFLYNSASGGTFTLPTSSLVDGMVVEVAQIGAGALTVSGGTIVGTAVTSSQYQALRFVYVASGTTWYAVAESSPAGLSIVAPTSIANSGGSASASGGAVTFTGVSSISLNGVFSATYDNYRVIVTAVGSVDMSLTLRLRSAGTDRSGSSYVTQRLLADGTSVSGTRSATTTLWTPATYTFTTLSTAQMEISLPFVGSANTALDSMGLYTYNDAVWFSSAGIYKAADSNDGFTLTTSAGTVTGNVRVYGYKNS